MSSNDFAALPQYLQNRIDKAFDQSNSQNVTEMPSSGGGFISEPSSGGGFFPEATQIPLSAIPTALHLLDLPPDDEQVLLVFKNAAAGWASATNKPEEIGEASSSSAQELFVSRDDWRSVCAVLLEHHAEEYADSDGDAVGEPPEPRSASDSDEYRDPDGGSDSSADEYIEGPRRRGTRARRARSSSASSDGSPKKLTARQQRACLETFALFFPSASASELPKQRIMIKDIQRVTKLIGDKLKADEVCVSCHTERALNVCRR
ncbi:hypothetical protein B0H10DRAFT_2108413 [Mycena sp. CBHHK59/15]|nr:hypothetical protein B0H10DRAFT_2108413 [Mycena sp. CBHHK59/15]